MTPSSLIIRDKLIIIAQDYYIKWCTHNISKCVDLLPYLERAYMLGQQDSIPTYQQKEQMTE